MLKRLVLALLLLGLPVGADAAVKFLEAGSDATQGLEFWSSSSGTVTSATDQAHTGSRAIKTTLASDGAVTKTGIMGDAGRRISIWFRLTAVPDQASGFIDLLRVQDSGGNKIFELQVYGVSGTPTLQPFACQTGGGCTGELSQPTFTLDAWHRLVFSYVITNSTTWTMFWSIDGGAGASDSNTRTITTSTADLRLASDPNDATTGNGWFDDIYVDDGTGHDDPGDIRVAAKEPAANNTGNFTDSFGVAAPANRYTNVDDRPLDATTGWINTNTTANAENYTLESASAGDVNLGSGTVVGYTHWGWSKRLGQGSNASDERWAASGGSCSKQQTGTDTSITCTGMTIWPGQTLYCALMTNNATVTSVSVADTLSNTWTALNATSAGSGLLMFPYYSSMGTGTKGGAGTTVTFSYTSTAARKTVGCIAFDGTANSSPLDANPANTTDSTSTYNTNATGTLAQANEIVIAPFVLAHSSEAITCASPTGTDTGVAAVTSAGSATTNVDFRFCYTLVAATTTLTPAATSGTNRTGLQGVATFKIRGNATPGVGTPKLTNNGTDTAQTLTTTPALYTVITTSSSYPSNAAGVGMVASGATASTIFYEGGALVAYIPAAPTCQPASLVMMGAGC